MFQFAVCYFRFRVQKKHCERKLISSFSERQFCRAARNFKIFMTKLFLCLFKSLFRLFFGKFAFILVFKCLQENFAIVQTLIGKSFFCLACLLADLFSSIFTFRRFNENLCSFSRVIVNNQRNLIRKKFLAFFQFTWWTQQLPLVSFYVFERSFNNKF